MTDPIHDERPRLGVLLGADSAAEADAFEEVAAVTLALLAVPLAPPRSMRDALLADVARLPQAPAEDARQATDEPRTPTADTPARDASPATDEGAHIATARFLDGRASVTVRASTANRRATAQFDGLPAAPSGKTYQFWFIRTNRLTGRPRPLSAGTFDRGAGPAPVRIDRRYRAHDVVAVTLEPASGSRRPTTEPLFALET